MKPIRKRQHNLTPRGPVFREAAQADHERVRRVAGLGAVYSTATVTRPAEADFIRYLAVSTPVLLIRSHGFASPAASAIGTAFLAKIQRHCSCRIR